MDGNFRGRQGLSRVLYSVQYILEYDGRRGRLSLHKCLYFYYYILLYSTIMTFQHFFFHRYSLQLISNKVSASCSRSWFISTLEALCSEGVPNLGLIISWRLKKLCP